MLAYLGSRTLRVMAVGVVFLIVVQIQGQSVPICDTGGVAAWLTPNRQLLPAQGVGVASGIGQCNQISGGIATFSLIQSPTAFTLRARNPLTCGTNGRCPIITQTAPASNLIPICDGVRVVAWLTVNRQLLPLSGAVTPTGQGQCFAAPIIGGPSTFSMNLAPTTFTLRSNSPLTCGQNGLCPNINPRSNFISLCDPQGVTRAFLTNDMRLLPPGGTAVATGSGQCLNQYNPPQFRLTMSPNFGLVNGGNLYCTNQQCPGGRIF